MSEIKDFAPGSGAVLAVAASALTRADQGAQSGPARQAKDRARSSVDESATACITAETVSDRDSETVKRANPLK